MLSPEYIYSQLSNVKNHENWDTGLNGRSAVALFFFHYSKFKKNIEVHNKGIDLLEYELNNLESVSNVSLFNGLAGIAWTVNYLSSENIVEIDHDEFLPSLLEDELRIIFFSGDILISNDQFKNCSDIFLYFIERFFTTKSELLKEQYDVFINQALILFTHFFHQLEIHKLYEKLDPRTLISFIKNINILKYYFLSPLTNFLLFRSIEWVSSIQMPSNIHLPLLLKSAEQLNDTKLYKKLVKVQSINKEQKVELDKINILENIGIWDSGYSRLGLKSIVFEGEVQKNSLKYLFDLD
jgi:hypothetical protein